MYRLILTICVLWGIAATPALAEPRLALVIGNSDYHSLGMDDQAGKEDARLMAETLERLGFKVRRMTDSDRGAMREALADFGKSLFDAGSEATGVFYFSGLGVQHAAGQVLLPTDAQVTDVSDLDQEGIDVAAIVRQMKDSGCRTKIVILETDRNNPLDRSGSGDDLPLSVRDFFLANATAHGEVRSAAPGGNNLFTRAFARAMLERQGDIATMARVVRLQVMTETDMLQVPTDISTLTASFSF